MGELEHTLRDLVDHKGGKHLYDVTPLDYDTSFNLGLELADLIGGPIGEALAAMLSGDDVDLSALDGATIGHMLSKATDLPRRILNAGGAKLVGRLFKGTMRVGGTPEKKEKQYLDTPEGRTAAFAGGNQRESVEAMRLVLEVNYGPFLTDLWELVSPYWNELGFSLGSSSPKSQEPEETTESEIGDGQPTKMPQPNGEPQ